MVIVWKLDRFARNRYDSARYKAALKKNGVKVMSATEVISEGAEAIILESVLEGYTEYYSADLSEKVIRGLTENALKCKFNGGTLPIGYVIDSDQHFQIDGLTAPFVHEAFQMYADGFKIHEILEHLSQKGLKNTRGGKLTYNNIQSMLHNRRYIGEFRYRDTVIPDGIPAIISKELFAEVQECLEKNKKTPARHKAEEDYILTTKLFCGKCGAMIFGESGKGRSGNIYRYYKCANVKNRKTCDKKPVQKEWLENLVVKATMKIVMDDKAIEAIVAMLMAEQEKENTDLPYYEKQLSEVNAAIENMLNAIQMGILTRSTKARLDQLEQSKDDLETKIQIEKIKKPKVEPEFLTFWLTRFRKMDMSSENGRKMLIDTFVSSIFLYDDKLIITFNYRDGKVEISLSELNELAATGSDMVCSTAPQKALSRKG